MNKQSLAEFKVNVCHNTLCQVRLEQVSTLSILIQCQNYHDESDKRRNPKSYKPIYIGDNNVETSEFCNNIIEYLYHPAIYGTQPCIFNPCSSSYCPFSHQKSNSFSTTYKFKFINKLEAAIEQKQRDMNKKYIINQPISIFEDQKNELKHFKELRLDLIFNYINAFLNALGGTLYIGINDDGIVTGIKLKRKQIDEFQLDLDHGLKHFDPFVLPEQVKICMLLKQQLPYQIREYYTLLIPKKLILKDVPQLINQNQIKFGITLILYHRDIVLSKQKL